MKTEFEALYIYLVGDNMYEDFIRKKFEAKFGTKTVSKLESLWIVLYINDTLFAFGKNRNLNSKLLFLAGLIEVSKHNEKLFPHKEKTLIKLLFLPVLIIIYLVNLFIK